MRITENELLASLSEFTAQLRGTSGDQAEKDGTKLFVDDLVSLRQKIETSRDPQARARHMEMMERRVAHEEVMLLSKLNVAQADAREIVERVIKVSLRLIIRFYAGPLL